MTELSTNNGRRNQGFFGALMEGLLEYAAETAERAAAESDGLVIDAETFGQLMRIARVERELSLRQLATETGISRYRLERFESENIFYAENPTFDEMVKIKAALKISAASVRKFL